MEEYRNGDIITLRFDDDRYIPGKILQIEPLTLHDIIHVRLYDMLVAGGPGGYDNQGEYRDRVHNLPEHITSHTPLFDSIALTSTAFEDSDPVVVAFEDVKENELGGYGVWVTRRREAAERRGLIRYDRVADEDGEDEDGESVEDEFAGEEFIDDGEEPAEPGEIIEEYVSEEVVEEIIIEPRPWHDAVYDVPLGSILRDLGDVLTSEPYNTTAVGQAIARRREEGEGEIGDIVGRLVNDGDYAAGQELLDYGNHAVPALSAALAQTDDPQTVEDICQILADMGTDSSYEALARAMEERVDRIEESESARAAARSYLYAVMLTGGGPEPLRRRLDRIDRMGHPDLKDDVESALAAMKAGGEDVPAEPQQKSSDPFGL